MTENNQVQEILRLLSKLSEKRVTAVLELLRAIIELNDIGFEVTKGQHH